jgi:6-phosphogluconolactonase
VSPDGKQVFASHYRDGALTILSTSKGRLTGFADSVILRGSSINKQRQETAHAHFTQFLPELNFLVTADLGSDKLWIHSLQKGKIRKPEYAAIATVPGSGPRHFVYYPRKAWIYVAEELSSTVSQYYFHPDKMTIRHLQRVSTLPETFQENNSAADIHLSPDLKFLYVSNRGHNSIAIYRVDALTGELTPVGHQSTLGKTPRNFYVDTQGEFVLVANQDSDDIVFFTRNNETGLLQDTGIKLKVPSPVCLKMGI